MLPSSYPLLLNASDHWDGPGAWWPIFPILWFLLIASVVGAFLLNGRRNRRWGAVRSGEARLAERFASGEIADEEYRYRLGVLKEKR